MKKITLLMLTLFVIATGAVFAASIQQVDNNAWLNHTAKMQVIRENILTLVSKELPTATDKAELASLMELFTVEKNQWSNYIQAVAKAPSASASKCDKTSRKYRRHAHRNCKTSYKSKRHGYRNSNCTSKLIGHCPKCDGSCKKAKDCKTSYKSKRRGYRNSNCTSKLIGNCPKCDGSCKKAKDCKTSYKSKRRGYRNSNCTSKLIGKCPKCDGSCVKARVSKTSCGTAIKSSCKTKKRACKSNCK